MGDSVNPVCYTHLDVYKRQVFAEPDESSGLAVLEKIGRDKLRDDKGYQSALKDLRQSLDYDRRFADTLKGRLVVLGFYFSGLEAASKSGASVSYTHLDVYKRQILTCVTSVGVKWPRTCVLA